MRCILYTYYCGIKNEMSNLLLTDLIPALDTPPHPVFVVGWLPKPKAALHARAAHMRITLALAQTE
jgi:hypothetical protein